MWMQADNRKRCYSVERGTEFEVRKRSGSAKSLQQFAGSTQDDRPNTRSLKI